MPLRLWVKDNKPSARLKAYCHQNGIFYTDSSPGLGFGENNNFLFDLIRRTEVVRDNDSFIVMNPDITITTETILALIAQMRNDHIALASINLYRDHARNNVDLNVRRFPDIFSPFRMLSSRSLTQTYDKKNMPLAQEVDWASGALLAFDASHYARLRGFDLHYFMYFEDVDLCYRSRKFFGAGVRYYPQFSAIHLAARQGRNLMSPHAFWFIRGFLTFLLRRYCIYGKQAEQVAGKKSA
jgi:N-acetylglucosaminyl-diphospho-decaprenol L-rhamnosyltransferase